MDRRSFLKAAAAFGGLLAARPFEALAGAPLGAGGPGRLSRLPSGDGLLCVHTDLHNHSLISGDAFGNPNTALLQMKEKGIDVACLTEHAISGKGHGEITCKGHEYGGCHTIEGINDADWEVMNRIANDANDEDHGFVSFRGFEWSTPTVGHLNVWFSRKYTDGLRQHAFFTPPAAAEIDRVFPVPSEIVDNFEKAPDIATMRFFYDWLASHPDRDVLEGGNDGIAGFNHPNEFGNFENFRYDASVAPYIVSCEALNADRDFFWYGTDKKPNPLKACLDAGWRVGFTGVSDEHSTEYGRPGMARGGLWVTATTRDAVRAALFSRRSFATFEHGLRLDAEANGVPMGGALSHSSGSVSIEIDLAAPDWAGKTLFVEVVQSGPSLAGTSAVTVPASGTIAFDVAVSAAQTRWFFLRILDPARPRHPLAAGPFDSVGGAVAYASPWFLTA